MQHRSGFTIIEVVLFLAISSSMAVLLLAGTGLVLQQQRYRDSVQSFASFFRGQYSRVISVENERAAGSCPIASADAGPTAIGQSNCVIVGRYIMTENGTQAEGASYQSFPVYGAKRPDGTWTYTLGGADTTYALEWKAKTHFGTQSSNGAAPISIVMYRDPDFGRLSIKTSSGTYTVDTITEFMNSAAASTETTQEVCVYDTNWMTGQRQSVFLGARAGSSDAIFVGNAEADGCKNA